MVKCGYRRGSTVLALVKLQLTRATGIAFGRAGRQRGGFLKVLMSCFVQLRQPGRIGSMGSCSSWSQSSALKSPDQSAAQGHID